ncbi:LuxR C-terminal-related transcriptional regulator [Streptomyces sp. NPDC006784]|uniref:LuxR C-terminal-related transcriptional regulator n=1 Tax=Streptomyces sp. NPDC006784 TaxID=3364764 RepID=UPI0036C6B0A9
MTVSRELSETELAVLRRTADGDTYSEIGHHINLTTKSVANVATRVMRKLGAVSMPHAVYLATRTGLLDAPLDNPLTARQLEALLWTALGYTAQHAADHMGVSLDTVRWLLRTTHHRLGARTATHAVALAMAAGLITPAHITTRRQEHAA